MELKVTIDQCHKRPLANPSMRIITETPRVFKASHTFFIKARFSFGNNSCTFCLVENKHPVTCNYKTSDAHEELSSSVPQSWRRCDRKTTSSNGYGIHRTGLTFSACLILIHCYFFPTQGLSLYRGFSLWPTEKEKNMSLDYTWLHSLQAEVTQKLILLIILPNLERLLRKVNREILPLGSIPHGPQCQEKETEWGSYQFLKRE